MRKTKLSKVVESEELQNKKAQKRCGILKKIALVKTNHKSRPQKIEKWGGGVHIYASYFEMKPHHQHNPRGSKWRLD